MLDVDADNSGFIDYSEFVMAATKREYLLDRNNLEAAFKIFD
jgi:Ca2+-binding EF-hand superfamily protein